MWVGRFDTLGKLVSAHRAWGPTPHGGWVSGGRQWGGAGLPAWWVSLPGQCLTLHGQCATILMMPDYFLATFMLIWQAVLMGTSEISAEFGIIK